MPLSHLHTYAFLQTPTKSLDLPQGIASQVQIIQTDRLSAIVESGISAVSLETDSDRLMAAVLSHDRVLCSIFRQTAILPLRFGTYFASPERLQTYMRSHAEDYLEKLKKLTGKGEYTLKFYPLPPPQDSPPPEVGGRQYFLAKKQRYQLQQDFRVSQTTQWQKIAELIAKSYPSIFIGSSSESEERIYILANHPDESQLREDLQTWQQTCPHWQIELGEALPPYRFATLE